MEITLYVLMFLLSMFFTYLSYSKNVDQTNINKAFAGLLWINQAFNSLNIHYYIPLSMDYIRLSDNSQPWGIAMCIILGFIGMSMWVQIFIDKFFGEVDGRS